MEQNRIKERLLKMYRLATDGVDEEIRMAKRACRMINDLEDVSFKKHIGSGQKRN